MKFMLFKFLIQNKDGQFFNLLRVAFEIMPTQRNVDYNCLLKTKERVPLSHYVCIREINPT